MRLLIRHHYVINKALRTLLNSECVTGWVRLKTEEQWNHPFHLGDCQMITTNRLKMGSTSSTATYSNFCTKNGSRLKIEDDDSLLPFVTMALKRQSQSFKRWMVRSNNDRCCHVGHEGFCEIVFWDLMWRYLIYKTSDRCKDSFCWHHLPAFIPGTFRWTPAVGNVSFNYYLICNCTVFVLAIRPVNSAMIWVLFITLYYLGNGKRFDSLVRYFNFIKQTLNSALYRILPT